MTGVNIAVNMELLSGALHPDEQTGIWRHVAAAADLHRRDQRRLLPDRGRLVLVHAPELCIVAAVRRFPPDGFILDISGGTVSSHRG